MAEHGPNRTGNEAKKSTGSGESHSLAIGFYIAAAVLIFGTILVLYGLLGPAEQTQKSLGLNINLWWGLFMVVFGCVTLGMSLASPRRRSARQLSGQR